MNRLKPTNQVVVIAIVASIAFAYVSSLFINRYKLSDNGRRRIDTLTGRVWILTPEYRKRPINTVISDLRSRFPKLEALEDNELYERVSERYPDVVIDKSVTEYLYWERVQEQ